VRFFFYSLNMFAVPINWI